jgi:hypothetical protein
MMPTSTDNGRDYAASTFPAVVLTKAEANPNSAYNNASTLLFISDGRDVPSQSQEVVD